MWMGNHPKVVTKGTFPRYRAFKGKYASIYQEINSAKNAIGITS